MDSRISLTGTDSEIFLTGTDLEISLPGTYSEISLTGTDFDADSGVKVRIRSVEGLDAGPPDTDGVISRGPGLWHSHGSP